MQTKCRVADLDDYRNTAWAIHADTLATLAALDVEAAAALQAQRTAPAAAKQGNGVAVITLHGIVMPGPSLLAMLLGAGGGLQGVRESLREAVASDDVAGIVLDIDSPGGSTDLLPETAEEIRAARAVKPVVAVANTWAASAAYWLASQADEVVVTPSGEAGSIGVFMAHDDISGLNEHLGVKTTLISAGKYKTEGNPFEALSEEAHAALQARTDAFYDLFVSDVAKGRGVTAGEVKGGFGEGRMLTAKPAVAAGLADRVDTLDNTLARMARAPGRIPRRTATELQPAPQGAAEKETADNPGPNDIIVMSEEDRARIGALLAQHPQHTIQEKA